MYRRKESGKPQEDWLHRIVDSLTHRWRSRRASLHRLAASALGTSTTIEASNATGSHHFLHSNALQVLLRLELCLNILVSLQQSGQQQEKQDQFHWNRQTWAVVGIPTSLSPSVAASFVLLFRFGCASVRPPTPAACWTWTLLLFEASLVVVRCAISQVPTPPEHPLSIWFCVLQRS